MEADGYLQEELTFEDPCSADNLDITLVKPSVIDGCITNIHELNRLDVEVKLLEVSDVDDDVMECEWDDFAEYIDQEGRFRLKGRPGLYRICFSIPMIETRIEGPTVFILEGERLFVPYSFPVEKLSKDPSK